MRDWVSYICGCCCGWDGTTLRALAAVLGAAIPVFATRLPDWVSALGNPLKFTDSRTVASRERVAIQPLCAETICGETRRLSG